MDALRESDATLTVYVHPSNTGDVRRAVALQLSSLLFSYEDRFDGVLLAHEFQFVGQKDNIKAKILNGLVPYFAVPVKANLLLFSPQPDMMLEGKVEMLGKESIHAIILGVFSVAIMSEDIHSNFKFRRKGDEGRFISRSDKHHVIKKGSMIRFYVKKVDTEMNCHITGSLILPHTGSVNWLSVHDDEYPSAIMRCVAERSRGRRSRDIKMNVEQAEQENGKFNNINDVKNCGRPLKSRKRNFEER